MAYQDFAVRGFTCRIGDNAADGSHRAGYNGVWSLVPTGERDSLFVPGIAGLNLEHYFDGWHNGSREIFFEPRVAPMALQPVDGRTLRLRQAPTPFWGVESTTLFRVEEPNRIRLTWSGIPRRPQVLNGGVMGVFWASYIHRPEDDRIHFRAVGREAGWTAFRSAAHGDRSSVRGPADTLDLMISPGNAGKLFSSCAEVRWKGAPAYYGRWRDRVYAVAFRTRELLRFAMSPSGGGAGNPAWDFQILVPDCRAGGEVRLEAVCMVDRWEGPARLEEQMLSLLRRD